MSTEPTAKIIADSVSPRGSRVTTMEATLHRFVLSELNTHRVFSRNSASSRAIPVEKQLAAFTDDPWYPVEWPAEQRGMQGGNELEGEELADAKKLLEDIHDFTANAVSEYLNAHPEKSNRLHKSLINRVYEWGQSHKVIITATDWDGFWEQRCSPLAQPEIRVVAEQMQAAYNGSTPTPLDYGDWHLPYIDNEDYDAAVQLIDYVPYNWEEEEHRDEVIETIKQVSSARCARVSYLTHDGVRSIEKDIELYERLTSARPWHASPLEHVATPSPATDTPGNLRGWSQFRHIVEKDM